MGSFNILVPVSDRLEGSCAEAVAVDRMVYPYMRYPICNRPEREKHELESYYISRENIAPNRIYAFINEGGHWQCQRHPDWGNSDPDAEPVFTSLKEWHEEVAQWAVMTVKNGYKLISVVCHD